MAFEWDRIKAKTNKRRHGIDFADAVGVFDDPLALTLPDLHTSEERFVTLGQDYLDRLVIVVWTWRGEFIRVISAREPTARERRQYLEDPDAQRI